jgi:hypothetical protein
MVGYTQSYYMTVNADLIKVYNFHSKEVFIYVFKVL